MDFILLGYVFMWILTLSILVWLVDQHDKFIGEQPKIESIQDYYKKFNN